MTEKELENVKSFLVDNIFRNPTIMFSDERMNSEKDEEDLPYVIASLYELLHREVTGEPYSYMFHWANKIGSWVEDDLFIKEMKDNEKD